MITTILIIALSITTLLSCKWYRKLDSKYLEVKDELMNFYEKEIRKQFTEDEMNEVLIKLIHPLYSNNDEYSIQFGTFYNETKFLTCSIEIESLKKLKETIASDEIKNTFNDLITIKNKKQTEQ